MSTADAAQQPQLQVLVIDDEVRFSEALARVLRQAGHGVATAADGANAVRIAQSKTFDVVICDLRLNGENGISVAEEIAARVPVLEKRIIVTSGAWPSEADSRRLLQRDFDYVTKPFEEGALIELMEMIWHRAAGHHVKSRADG